MTFKKNLIVYGILTLALAGCGSDSDDNDTPNSGDQTPSESISLELSNIEPMSGQHYEGWVITADGAESSGRFNVNEDGDVISVNAAGEQLAVLGQGTVNFAFDGDKDSATTFVLTIEPDGDEDAGPSAVHYVGGDFVDGKTKAVLSHGSSIGQSFADVTGSFILATPTQGPETHNQGVWYIEDGAASLASLPSLDGNWVYEGWVVNTNTGDVVSTGTFSSPSESDSDAGGASAGPNPAPAFPDKIISIQQRSSMTVGI